ncbi:MAG: tripartite tricarboxylate transporter TctB family protein [Sulfuritalea sp.]
MSAAISMFVFGAITAVLSLQLPLGALRMPGSGFFPFTLGLALMALAAGHGVRIYLARPKAAAAQAPASSTLPEGDGATRRVVLFVTGVIAAVVLLKPLGYTLASFLLMLALLQILGIRRWYISLAVALGSAATCHVVFVRLLQIPLPSGWIF